MIRGLNSNGEKNTIKIKLNKKNQVLNWLELESNYYPLSLLPIFCYHQESSNKYICVHMMVLIIVKLLSKKVETWAIKQCMGVTLHYLFALVGYDN